MSFILIISNIDHNKDYIGKNNTKWKYYKIAVMASIYILRKDLLTGIRQVREIHGTSKWYEVSELYTNENMQELTEQEAFTELL